MPPDRLAGNDHAAARSARLVLEFPMPARLPCLTWAMRAALIAGVLLPSLSDCGPARNQFAPVCPRPAFLADAADLDRYRTPGTGPRDLVLHARMVTVAGECKPGDKKGEIVTALTVGIELTRGPAMTGREADALYFVAVIDGSTIVDKRVYTTHIAFPPNVDRYNWQSDEVDITLPISPTKSGAAYTVLVGFQLTPDELAANRQR
jgi:hypothetical protein